MNVYISGPITGHPDYAETFSAAARELADAGHTPINPALLGDGDHPWTWYARQSLIMLLTQADAIALLPDWEFSRGARVEHAVGVALQMPVRELHDWLGKPVMPPPDVDEPIPYTVTQRPLVRCDECHGDGCQECDYVGTWTE